MSNVIPGTNYVTSPGVLSGFDQYLADKRAREVARTAAAEALDTVEQAQEVAKEKTVKAKAPKAPRVNDKKEAARRIFDANKGKGNGEIAKLISTELEITYANAYYYVTRVFK